MDQLNILQWNAQSLNSNKDIFTNFLYNNDIHIAIISETWFKLNQNFKIKHYNIEHINCGNNHNGVAIIIHKNIAYSVIKTYSDSSLQNICVRIKINNLEISIISLYSPINCNPSFDKSKLDRLIKSVPGPILLAGDFNAHHTSWGCVSNSVRGKDVLDIIDDNNLVLLNDGQVTTLGSLTWRPNALDLTIVSPLLALSCEWSVHNTPLGTSYHLPVIVKITINSNQIYNNKCNSKHPPVYPNFRLVDWKSYTQNVQDLLDKVDLNHYSVLDTYAEFCNILLTAVSQSINVPHSTRKSQNNICPNNVKHRKRPTLPWWNKKCEESVFNSKQAYITFKHNPTEANYVEFKRLRALKKLTLKTEKKASWVAFCNDFNRCTPQSRIWNLMRKFNKTYTYNNVSDDFWVADFLKKYTPDSVQENLYNANFTDQLNSGNNFLLEQFTLEELKSAIVSRRDTSAGLDGLSYILFKKLNDTSLLVLLKLFNLLWQNNIVPEQWKTDCLIPILKPNKQKSQPDSYRPIALTSCAGKIFEQLLKQRLEFYVENNRLLPNNQFGFRKGFSARESICQFQLDMLNNKVNNRVAVSVFFDISAAFNNVNISILASELLSIGIPGKFVSWLHEFLINRKVFVKYNCHLYGPRFSSLGVCQGGILSPLLFILYIRRLNIILGPNVRNLQFADDLVVYSSANSINEATSAINNALKKLKQYFDYINLEVNPSKSNVMIFGKRLTLRVPDICYGAEKLTLSSKVKFLGVIFTQNLSWQAYVDKIVERASSAFKILKSLSATYWGADPKVLLMLYKSLVRSHFEYGFLCFAQDQKITNLLDKIQNKCMRLITGAFITSPIGALQIECNLPPIKIRFDYLKERYILKLNSNINNNLLKNISRLSTVIPHKLFFILQNFVELSYSFQMLDIHKTNISPCFEGSFKDKYPAMNIVIDHTLSNREDVYKKFSNWNNYKFIYTDGSKTSSSVSFAIYEPNSNIGLGYKLDNNFSIFSAEAVAILCALKHIQEHNRGCLNWVIVSDSMSVLKNLKNNVINANANYIIYAIKQLWVKLSNLNIQVDFLWVPSHIGVKGNERADALAKAVIKFSNLIPENKHFKVSIACQDVILTLKQRMQDEWRKYWYNLTHVENKGSWYDKLEVQVNSKPWFLKYQYVHRKFYSTICRLRLGHCRLNFHLYRIKLVNSPLCDYCTTQEEQTLDHIIFGCTFFGIQRLMLMDVLIEIYGQSDKVPLTALELLMNHSTYSAIYTFIYNTVNEI